MSLARGVKQRFIPLTSGMCARSWSQKTPIDTVKANVMALAKEVVPKNALMRQSDADGYAAPTGCIRERSGRVWLSKISSSPSRNGPASPPTGLSIIFSPR